MKPYKAQVLSNRLREIAMYAGGAARDIVEVAEELVKPEHFQPGKHVPWVPSNAWVIERMLDVADVGAQDYVIDLGSGDGRVVVAAARRGARAHGVELNPELMSLARTRLASEQRNCRGIMSLAQEDLFSADVSKATVIILFALPSVLDALYPKMKALSPGTRIVSNSFAFTGWEPTTTVKLSSRFIVRLWVV